MLRVLYGHFFVLRFEGPYARREECGQCKWMGFDLDGQSGNFTSDDIPFLKKQPYDLGEIAAIQFGVFQLRLGCRARIKQKAESECDAAVSSTHTNFGRQLNH